MMTGTETVNQHTILATRLGDLTVVRNAEAVVGLYFPHHWYRPGPDTFGPRTDEGFDEVERQLNEYLAGGRQEFDLPLQAPVPQPDPASPVPAEPVISEARQPARPVPARPAR